jgi:phosphatidyl-myo-inositol dimannoside synthase
MALNLLLLSLDYPPNDGGISKVAGDITRTLTSKGCLTRVVTFSANDNTGSARSKADYLEISKHKGLRDLQLMYAVNQVGRDTRILATKWNPEATMAMLAGARRVSILVHGDEIMEHNDKPLRTWVRRLVFERAHQVICNSRFNEKLVHKIAPKAQTSVLNPGINIERFKASYEKTEIRQKLGLPLGKKILLTVSRLVENKGHETVLRAISSLNAQQRSKLLYVVIGKGYMLEQLKTLTKQLKIIDQVKYVGFKDDDLPLWYQASDLFVLTSTRIEGFGIVFIEAQAAGLAVIGTRCGGIPDAVREGEGGWLIDERDTDALASHLKKLLTEPEAIEEQGRLGFARMKREFSLDNYVRRLLELI